MDKKILGIDRKDLVFIGRGVEGKVFLTPEGNALKVYRDPGRCKSEYKILKEMEDNPYFPKVIERKRRYMLREYVKGTPIREYIQKKGLSRDLALNLIEFTEVFEKLNIKVDGINKHIFIQEDESIKVVDPRRKKKYKIHRWVLITLKREGLIEYFLKVLEEERPDQVSKWSKDISKILKKRNKKY
ncbi:MAG: serine/threonine protein kinase [Marinisporobacter sp.]|nr:serine/threonine protein kinase [Marinisporobacter sp.]